MAPRARKFDTRQHMIRKTYEVFRYRDAYLNEVALHHHDFYEIYLFLSGNVDYVIESRVYHLTPGDILLISPNELHQPMFGWDRQSYERIVVWIDKSYLQQFTSMYVDLARCFDTSDPGHVNLIRPDNTTRQQLTDLLEKVLIETDSAEFGSQLFADTCLALAMLMINRLAEWNSGNPEMPDKSSSVVGSVLAYINEHYAEDLSLDLLANKFFISKYHLSREFNRLVGTSVHRYIIQKRLVIAKQLMGEGVPSTTVYQHCGFGDYSNFYRAFKAEYQITPKEYITSLKEDAARSEEQKRERSWLWRDAE